MIHAQYHCATSKWWHDSGTWGIRTVKLGSLTASGERSLLGGGAEVKSTMNALGKCRGLRPFLGRVTWGDYFWAADPDNAPLPLHACYF